MALQGSSKKIIAVRTGLLLSTITYDYICYCWPMQPMITFLKLQGKFEKLTHFLTRKWIDSPICGELLKGCLGASKCM